jgi:hypothetical protein
MKKLSLLLMLCVFGGVSHAQSTEEMLREVKIRFFLRPATNLMYTPTRLNNTDFKNGSSTTEITDGFTLTPGLCFNFGLNIIESPWFTAGLFQEYSEGWFFGESHSYNQQGIKIRGGLPNFQVTAEWSRFPFRKVTGFYVEYGTDNKYDRSYQNSAYDNISRSQYGIAFNTGDDLWLEAAYLEDSFQGAWISGKKAQGIVLGLNNTDGWYLNLDLLFNHPVRGSTISGTAVPTTLKADDLFFNLKFGTSLSEAIKVGKWLIH